MDIKEKSKQLSEQIVKWRRELHQIPETGLQLPQTSQYIRDRLDEMGITYQTYEKHSGIVALIGKEQGKVVGLRADMDGLNVTEANRLDYASKNGKMHACGHDAHSAILLGAASILKKAEGELKGQAKLIFQPDEENISGAKAMIADGVLENPKMDCMFALHVGSIIGNGNKVGDLLYKSGPVYASSDVFRIVIHGKSGHASTPSQAVNPILVTTHIISALEGLISREVPSNIPSVLTFTSVRAGNGSVNIIPDTAEILGGLRTLDPDVRSNLLQCIKEISESSAVQLHATAEFELLLECPPTMNDQKTTELFLRSAKKIMPEENMIELKTSSMGGEDASYFFSQVPGCYAFLYNPCPSDDGVVYPHHNGRFCIDDSVLYMGSAVIVQAAIDRLNE